MGTYYKQVEKFFNNIDRGIWIEIGVERGEGSSRWFAEHAKAKATKFYAVDADQNQIQSLTQLFEESGGKPANTELRHAKGEDFLGQLAEEISDEKVSLVYLDNFDWDYWLTIEPEPFVADVKKNYTENLGVEMTNMNSQLAHLAQAMWLVHIMSDHCVIICDDTWYHPQEGVFVGKCGAAVPYLLLNGFKIVDVQGYRQNSGLILTR
jgi:hypothetical protein